MVVVGCEKEAGHQTRKSTGCSAYSLSLRETHALAPRRPNQRPSSQSRKAVYAPGHVRESVEAVECLASSGRGQVLVLHVQELRQVLYKHGPSACLLFFVCVAHVVLLLPGLKQHLLHVTLLFFHPCSARGTRGKRGVGGQYPVRRQQARRSASCGNISSAERLCKYRSRGAPPAERAERGMYLDTTPAHASLLLFPVYRVQ